MPTQYDQVPYPSRFFPQATPERLALLARLFGMKPASVQRCRVLELGCGDGGNLIPLGFTFPESEFVGIDLSHLAVERGCAHLAELGIRNVELRSQDLMRFPADAGTFDYIIAHGLFSWVPAEVRRQMLHLVDRHLSVDGIAYISYNTLPGGYLRMYPRDLMRFHTREIADPAARIDEARRIVDFVLSARSNSNLESSLLRNEMAPYQDDDGFLFHDILADPSDPLYFLDFLDQAAAHGLQYLAEAEVHSMRTSHLPVNVRMQLESLPSRLVREQYLDFINCRRFRQTLLCRSGHLLTPALDPRALDELLISSSLRPSMPLSQLNDVDEIEFRTIPGQTVKIKEAVPKAVYLSLGSVYPRALTYEELMKDVCTRLQLERHALPDDLELKIVRMLLESFSNLALDFHTFQPACVAAITDRPVASVLARWQVQNHADVVSLNLKRYLLRDEPLRKLLPLLDGTRDLEQLRAALQKNNNNSASETNAESIQNSLRTLALYGLLSA